MKRARNHAVHDYENCMESVHDYEKCTESGHDSRIFLYLCTWNDSSVLCSLSLKSKYMIGKKWYKYCPKNTRHLRIKIEPVKDGAVL